MYLYIIYLLVKKEVKTKLYSQFNLTLKYHFPKYKKVLMLMFLNTF